MCQIIHGVAHVQKSLLWCVLLDKCLVHFVGIIHCHVVQPKGQIWQPIVTTAHPPQIIVHFCLILVVDQKKCLELVLCLHWARHFPSLSSPASTHHSFPFKTPPSLLELSQGRGNSTAIQWERCRTKRWNKVITIDAANRQSCMSPSSSKLCNWCWRRHSLLALFSPC